MDFIISEPESVSSKRESLFLRDKNIPLDDLYLYPSDQHGGHEVASNSQVDDLGNGKHLEQQRDSQDTTSFDELSTELLVAETGTGLRLDEDSHSMSKDLDALAESQPSSHGYDDSLLEKDTPETQSSAYTEDCLSLGEELRDARCSTDGKQPSNFLPIDALDRIITKERVKEEMRKLSRASSPDLDGLADDILDVSTASGAATSRKKIFAILALVEQLETIQDFVREGIYDSHLPFALAEKQKITTANGARKTPLELMTDTDLDGTGKKPQAIKSFHGWADNNIRIFEKTQWEVCIPIFFLNTEKDPKVLHYRLKETVVLPFIEDDEVKQGAKVGGFANVWRVKFHPAHHNHGKLASGKCENPSFAIKRLHVLDEKAFRHEVENLKRFSTRDHLPLIKLLGTYQWRQQYYLLFPWAEGTLQDFWKACREPLAQARDKDTALWFSEQCLELVEGMKMIHEWDIPDKGGHSGAFSFPTHQKHGLHGDLKPENILWFQEYEEKGKPSAKLGHFKISDLGLSRFHGTKSIANIDARTMGFSPTYRAPERDVKGRVTQSYDVWSLACVLLEFASWYLGGWEEVESFCQRRVQEDLQDLMGDGRYKEDRFFNFMRLKEGIPEGLHEKAKVCAIGKRSVIEEFEKLHHHPHCSDYLADLLELIETSLLRLGPEKRIDCRGIAESLRKLNEQLRKDSDYGINRVKKPPNRSPTLDSVLIDGDFSPEIERQLLKRNLHKGTSSVEQEAAPAANPVPNAIFSSPSSSVINLVASTARDSRPSSPERRAKFRLSKDLSTVQEFPAIQALGISDPQRHSCFDGEFKGADDATQPDGTPHSLTTESNNGANDGSNETVPSHFRDGQYVDMPESSSLQQNSAGADAEVHMAPARREVDASLDDAEVPEKTSSQQADRVLRAQGQTGDDDAEVLQPPMQAVAGEMGSRMTPATRGIEGQHHNQPSERHRTQTPNKLLEVPGVAEEGRLSSECPTLLPDNSDSGRDDDGHCIQMPSQIERQDRKNATEKDRTTKNTVTEKHERNGWLKLLFKKIPCFT
ncbi:hypothetical protein diail_7625 [Diaporthe ilicicola]|nr:hypothetical protein diail_7625 [Diaporthe ilicicola]